MSKLLLICVVVAFSALFAGIIAGGLDAMHGAERAAWIVLGVATQGAICAGAAVIWRELEADRALMDKRSRHRVEK